MIPTPLIAPARDKSPNVLIVTIVAFLVSAFFMITTVVDVIGARDELSEVKTFRAPGEDGSTIINFSDDLVIASIGFGLCLIITIICLVIYNRLYYYITLTSEGLELRKHSKGRVTQIALSEVTEVVAAAEAEAADPSQRAACDLEIRTSKRTYITHAHSRAEAEAARDAILAAKA